MKIKSFTLIELLVVVAIIAVLVAILLPALSSAKEVTRRGVCASQLHQIGIGIMLYAEDYSGRLPPPAPGAVTPIAFQPEFRNAALKYGLTAEVVYCPSSRYTKEAKEQWWTYHATEPRIGYMTLMAQTTVGWPENISPSRLPPIVEGQDLALFADLMVGYAYAWEGFYMGYHTGADGFNQYGILTGPPDGGNVLGIDGHVEWRSWDRVRFKIQREDTRVYW